MRNFLGCVLALSGLSLCSLHFLALAARPHFLWTMAGIIVLLAGLWLVLAAPSARKP